MTFTRTELRLLRLALLSWSSCPQALRDRAVALAAKLEHMENIK